MERDSANRRQSMAGHALRPRGGVDSAGSPEAFGASKHGGPGEALFPEHEDDRLIERTAVVFVVLADQDSQQFAVVDSLDVFHQGNPLCQRNPGGDTQKSSPSMVASLMAAARRPPCCPKVVVSNILGYRTADHHDEPPAPSQRNPPRQTNRSPLVPLSVAFD